MSYLFQILLLICLISCVLLSDAFWFWTGFINAKGMNGLCYKIFALVTGLAIYAGIDYFLLDYLMLVPEKIYVMA